jgi:hypothetical protein
MGRIATLFVATLAVLAARAEAREVVVGEERIHPYSANLPFCGDPSVIARVANRFAEKEAQFWRSDLSLVTFDRVRPVAFRPWTTETIPRRFCTADVVMSDGRKTQVDYSVREDLDFLGNGWGIEFCVRGVDRNLAYSPSCRMARP